MTGIESKAPMWDAESAKKIREITQCIVARVKPLKVFLFGSFASGTNTDESDYDFYIVVMMSVMSAKQPTKPTTRFSLLRKDRWTSLSERILVLK